MKTSNAFVLAAVLAASSAFAGDPRTATLDVTNMTCAACPITVRKALEKVPGVDSAKVDAKTHLAVVTFDPAKTTPQVLTKATADAGFPSSVKQLQ
ncbi:mercury resistance system periplasmic binding protein MerP [Piscinibacter koreensis]|uniref:Periplasmic mercury ion-binding protein n=1 Tax=Piscinibacter koreensis TaxID=2742824 RepID=A0A7Y6NTH0_9BURK|nr:mercury resistance system periplasmic binding protein MerP [Schlegelella koreensis]NUZ08887.1 mercury resistance system periplasmic binding protein MerP [Schlegelella koreensis]